MEKLYIVIPAYNEQDNISNTASVVAGIMRSADIDFEIVFVDDGSKDGTWAEISSCSQADPCVRGVRFSRNFGKEGAIFAGLRAVSGDCAVLIDCDLQHPPEIIPQMYSMWQSGAEVVEAVKSSRGKESLLYKCFAKSFYKMMKSSQRGRTDIHTGTLSYCLQTLKNLYLTVAVALGFDFVCHILLPFKSFRFNFPYRIHSRQLSQQDLLRRYERD